MDEGGASCCDSWVTEALGRGGGRIDPWLKDGAFLLDEQAILLSFLSPMRHVEAVRSVVGGCRTW